MRIVMLLAMGIGVFLVADTDAGSADDESVFVHMGSRPKTILTPFWTTTQRTLSMSIRDSAYGLKARKRSALAWCRSWIHTLADHPIPLSKLSTL
jgi:hypothetical protein